ncbi:MAG: flagellar assembly protein FliH [Formivibrio sp.]|nr:flagellar assembly protein FliH [Formivibrio sp.]
MAGSHSRVIPREELSEFQRWQFSTLLDDSTQHQGTENDKSAESVTPSEPRPDIPQTELPEPELLPDVPQVFNDVHFPTAEEVEAIERQAQEEGYQSGLAAGRLAAEMEVNRLRSLLSDVENVCRGAEVQLADEVLDLALVIARQMVRESLQEDRATLLPAIREAIAGLPTVREPARLILNPEDLTALEVLLAGELPTDYWRFVPDPSLSAGSCRIESSMTSIDLTLATRWNNLLRVLNRNQRADLTWDAVPQLDSSDHADLA